LWRLWSFEVFGAAAIVFHRRIVEFGEEQQGVDSSALCISEVCSSRIDSVGQQVSQNDKLSRAFRR